MCLFLFADIYGPMLAAEFWKVNDLAGNLLASEHAMMNQECFIEDALTVLKVVDSEIQSLSMQDRTLICSSLTSDLRTLLWPSLGAFHGAIGHCELCDGALRAI